MPIEAVRLFAGHYSIAMTMRYCHEMYGGMFKQYYGWYINQSSLSLGVAPLSMQFLPESCPDEVQELISSTKDFRQKAQIERERLNAFVSGPPRPEIEKNAVTYWRNVTIEEGENLKAIEREARRAHRKVTTIFENDARKRAGIRKVGEAWVSESILGKVLASIYPDSELVRHHRPKWLEGLELDYYLPARKLGFEYQGQQHYKPVKAWGGEKALKQVQARDRRKIKLCEENGVSLIHIKYSDALTREFVLKVISAKT